MCRLKKQQQELEQIEVLQQRKTALGEAKKEDLNTRFVAALEDVLRGMAEEKSLEARRRLFNVAVDIAQE